MIVSVLLRGAAAVAVVAAVVLPADRVVDAGHVAPPAPVVVERPPAPVERVAPPAPVERVAPPAPPSPGEPRGRRPDVERPPAPRVAEQLPDEVIGRQIDGPDGEPCVVVDADLSIDCP